MPLVCERAAVPWGRVPAPPPPTPSQTGCWGYVWSISRLSEGLCMKGIRYRVRDRTLDTHLKRKKEERKKARVREVATNQ